ncbi:hypothetical protein SeMB42_g01651 [Synchytrium endobioticum]|uniref:Uncharacterized protein n=1 Tax=Synchytrium endobioticum TaxID=286115 RepID=A0A507DK81_9FUNG|nr:hypothetical protein SeMB42_g01651 [Synchytrium endobioticum]
MTTPNERSCFCVCRPSIRTLSGRLQNRAPQHSNKGASECDRPKVDFLKHLTSNKLIISSNSKIQGPCSSRLVTSSLEQGALSIPSSW